MEKKPEDIIILHQCPKNYDHMMYGSWNMVRNRRTTRQMDRKSEYIEVGAPHKNSYLFHKVWKVRSITIITINYFHYMFHHRCLSGFWISLRFWKCLWFRICQASEYNRILNRLIQGPEYAWIHLNMPDYAGICMSMHKCTWRAFVTCPQCLFECMVTYFNEGYGLKEHEVVFLKRQNLIFL